MVAMATVVAEVVIGRMRTGRVYLIIYAKPRQREDAKRTEATRCLALSGAGRRPVSLYTADDIATAVACGTSLRRSAQPRAPNETNPINCGEAR